MGDWKEGLFRLAIFIAGGSFGAIIMAIFAVGRRKSPPQDLNWCPVCGIAKLPPPSPGARSLGVTIKGCGHEQFERPRPPDAPGAAS